MLIDTPRVYPLHNTWPGYCYFTGAENQTNRRQTNSTAAYIQDCGYCGLWIVAVVSPTWNIVSIFRLKTKFHLQKNFNMVLTDKEFIQQEFDLYQHGWSNSGPQAKLGPRVGFVWPANSSRNFGY